MEQSLRKLIFMALTSCSFNSFASGIPTVDVAAIVQLQQQLVQMKQQYEALKEQYSAITGNYGRGGVGLSQSLASASVVPGSWQEVVQMQQKGLFATKQQYYDKLIGALPQNLFQNPNGQSATTFKLSTDSVRAAMAGGDALYSEVQTHLNNISTLSQQVDATSNIKDAQDLQNRIATENGLLQSAAAKLHALNLNLQANLLNQQNQATKSNQQFFKWGTK